MKTLVYVIILLLIDIMLFIKPVRRVAARISAACDYPIQIFISFISALFDKLKKQFPPFRLAVLWYYGIVDGIINLVILLICRNELTKILTHSNKKYLILSSFRNLTPIGLILDVGEILEASLYVYSAYHLLSAAVGLILAAIIIDISSYITTYAAEKREKARIVACKLPTKWDPVSRFLFAVLYMISFSLLAQKIPALQFVRFLVFDASILLKIVLSFLILLLICAYFFRVFVPAFIAVGIGTIWILAGIPFINQSDSFFRISENLLNLFTVIWFTGMLFWSTFKWNLCYKNAQKAVADGTVKSFGAGEKLLVRIILFLIRLYRFEVGDNLRDRFLKQEPSKNKKPTVKPDQGNNANIK